MSFSLAACGATEKTLEDPVGDSFSGIVSEEEYAIGTFSSDDPVWGEKNAPLQMIVFSDFQCPFCKQTADHIESLAEDWIDTGKLRVQYRDFPLAKHKNSLSAHIAALAAHKQGRYLDMHRQLFDTQADWIANSSPEEFFVQSAELLGLDSEQFQKDYNDPNAIIEIKDDRDTGRDWGLTGVPSFYLNRELYQGALTQEALLKVLENEMNAS